MGGTPPASRIAFVDFKALPDDVRAAFLASDAPSMFPLERGRNRAVAVRSVTRLLGFGGMVFLTIVRVGVRATAGDVAASDIAFLLAVAVLATIVVLNIHTGRPFKRLGLGWFGVLADGDRLYSRSPKSTDSVAVMNAMDVAGMEVVQPEDEASYVTIRMKEGHEHRLTDRQTDDLGGLLDFLRAWHQAAADGSARRKPVVPTPPDPTRSTRTRVP